MTTRPIPIIALALLLVFAAPLASAQAAEEITRDNTLDIRFILRPGDVGEINLNMNDGGRIEYSIRTTDQRQILLDLHSHVRSAGDCEEPATYQGGVCYFFGPVGTNSQTSTFIAPSAGTYSFQVQRQELGDVNVLVTIQGEFGLDSLTDIETIEGSPGAPLILLVAALGLIAWRARRRE
jgi:hypothetical protein